MVALERELQEIPPAATASTTTDAIPLALRRQGASPRHVLAITFIGILVLALFASRDLPSWVGGLGDGPLIEWAQPLATKWDDMMASLGLTRPHEALRNLIRHLLDARW